MKKSSLWTFNPGLLKYKNEWIFAYRIVGFDGLRRIALCRLDNDFQIIPYSQVPYSDYSNSCRSWFADPRLYQLGNKIFIYWNSGWHEPQNFQYLQEIDPLTLNPISTPFEIILDGKRQPLEKNWTFFGNDPFYAVYSVEPHRILRVSLEDNATILCKDFISHDWNMPEYTEHYGKLRGSSPPVLVDNLYYSFCHSLYFINTALHYTATVYCFSATPPFHPVMKPVKLLALENPLGSTTMLPRLNTAVTQVNYPCGAHFEKGHFIISYGINDEKCAIAVIPYAEVIACLEMID